MHIISYDLMIQLRIHIWIRNFSTDVIVHLIRLHFQQRPEKIMQMRKIPLLPLCTVRITLQFAPEMKLPFQSSILMNNYIKLTDNNIFPPACKLLLFTTTSQEKQLFCYRLPSWVTGECEEERRNPTVNVCHISHNIKILFFPPARTSNK